MSKQQPHKARKKIWSNFLHDHGPFIRHIVASIGAKKKVKTFSLEIALR